MMINTNALYKHDTMEHVNNIDMSKQQDLK